MTTYFIEECKERIALYSKLLMAMIGIMVLDVGGMASILARVSDPSTVWGTTFGLLEAGAAVFVVGGVASSYFLYKIVKHIDQIGRSK